MNETQPLLELNNLHVAYGAVRALKGVSLKVYPGQVFSLLGANGAGKSTTLNAISGFLRPSEGSIRFSGEDIHSLRADRITGLGLVQVPEGRQVIATMSVEENLMMGAFLRKDRENIPDDLADVYRRFPRLGERRSQKSGLLSGGEQQMLALGRALMARPRLLMLDEPSMGLAPLIVNEVFDVLADLKSEGVTMLLVEQNARKALKLADVAAVLERGQIAYDGAAADLSRDPRVVEAYLG